MTAKLLGYLHCNFKDKETGNTVSGTNLYLVQPITSDYGKGASAFRQFVIDRKTPVLEVGAEYEIQYNRQGRLESITKK